MGIAGICGHARVLPNETLMAATYERINANTGPENIGGYSQAVVVSNATRRLYISGQIPEATVAILTADHHIGREAEFRDVLQSANYVAHGNYIVTLGIVPTQPSTGSAFSTCGSASSLDCHARRVRHGAPGDP